MNDNILVIKLGAFGDFVQAAGPFAAIRDQHKDDTITLLTSLPFAEFAAVAPWFDHVLIDTRPKFWQFPDWLILGARFRRGNFKRVYDLQTSDRSAFYYRLFWPGPKPEWSGIARGCSHPHANPERDFMHTIERQAEQLADAGITNVPPADYSWIKDGTDGFNLSGAYAVLTPGGAAHRPEKRWAPENFGAVAAHLAGQGITSVIIGDAAETPIAKEIISLCPSARDFTGQTSIEQVFRLTKGAGLALGNDTGPMHIAAMVGCPTLVLYSAASDPKLCAQIGPKVTILRRDALTALGPGEVIATAEEMLNPVP
ncbi:MAG: glycosyltransferase family 9 protein [Rhodospirillales bacterium]|nr:glycosyltransferase family 9 protein [Rhodospirillales bacterium]